jgi:hypothetical protein
MITILNPKVKKHKRWSISVSHKVGYLSPMKFLFAAVLCAMFFVAQAQPEPFVYTWGNIGLSESGIDVVQLPSGSIYYCGFSSQQDGSTKVLLVKFNENGQYQQEWLFGGDGQNVPFQMRLVNDVFVIAGRTQPNLGDVNGLLLRVDTLGNLLQWTSWGEPDRTEIFSGFDVYEDGNLAIGGIAGASNDVGNDAFVAKFNTAFELIWVTFSEYPENDLVNGIAVIDGNQCVVTGDRDIDNHHHNVFVARYDQNGEEEWLYFEDNGFNGGSKAIMVNAQNEVVVIGESSGPGFDPFEPTFARYTGTGDLIHHTYIPASDGSDAIFSIIEPIPGNYLMCGYGFNEATESVDVVIYYTDAMGVEVEKRFYNPDPGSDIAFKIFESVNGGYLVAGRTGNFNAGNLLIYDNIPLVLNVEHSIFGQTNLSCFPNPILSNQFLQTNFEWHTAQVFGADGRLHTESKNRSLQFANPGFYIVKFFDAAGAEIGTTRIICH